MARQALYRKWRSQDFSDVIGQQHVTQTFQNALETNRIGHAYLFTGPRGTGKTSTARILAKAVNCIGQGVKPCNICSICQAVTEGRLMDLIEIDAASNTSVDDIRDLRDKVDFRPGEAKIKFYIIDEVHMLSKSAFNALLKTLEEPPAHVIFVLATTEPEKIPATILSRCQRFDFRRIKIEDIAARLKFILENEGLQAEQTALTFIARQGAGSMRDAISLLDQLTAYGADIITLDLVHDVLGTVSGDSVKALIDHLINTDVTSGLSLIEDVMNSGVDPRQFTLQTLEYLRSLLLIKYGNFEQNLNLPQSVVESMKPQASNIASYKLLQTIQRFNQAVKDFKMGGAELAIPQLPLELAFLEMIVENPVPNHAHIPQSSQSHEVKQPTVAASQPIATAPVSTKNTPPPPAYFQKQTQPDSTLNKTTTVTDTYNESWKNDYTNVVSLAKQQKKGYHQYLTKPVVEKIDRHDKTIIISFAYEYRDAIKRAKKHKELIANEFYEKGWLVEFKIAPQHGTVSPVPEVNIENDPLIQTAKELGGEIIGKKAI